MNQTESQLSELIAFPSVSRVSNEDISDWVQDQLTSLNFEVERLSYRDENGVLKVSICGRRGPQGAGLAWFGHTDVVPADTWSWPDSGPWEAQVTTDRIYGRGSCDMKGSLASLLEAVRRVPEHSAPLFVVCTADEEIGFSGARQVAEESQVYREIVAGGSVGIIGEPTKLQVVHGHKGGCTGVVTSRGRAAHSSTAEGRNANMAMIPFLSELHQLTLRLEADPAWQDQRFEPPGISMNIGINDHTMALNITPAQSVCTFHCRPMPDQPVHDLLQVIEQAAEKHGLQYVLHGNDGALWTDPDAPFIRALEEISGTRSRTVAYGTDGCQFEELAQLAVLGPGCITQAHTDDEWISRQQLAAGADLYERLIRHWCCP